MSKKNLSNSTLELIHSPNLALFAPMLGLSEEEAKARLASHRMNAERKLLRRRRSSAAKTGTEPNIDEAVATAQPQIATEGEDIVQNPSAVPHEDHEPKATETAQATLDFKTADVTPIVVAEIPDSVALEVLESGKPVVERHVGDSLESEVLVDDGPSGVSSESNSPEIRLIDVDAICITAGTQTRNGINSHIVSEYSKLMTGGAKFPAIVVFQIDGDFVLTDGFHRLAATKKADLKTISAEVRQGNRADALTHALQCNHTHGLRRTNLDKRFAIKLALNEFRNLSDRAIADMCGVCQPSVGRVRRKLKHCISSETRLGRDGKTRRLPKKPTPKVNGPSGELALQDASGTNMITETPVSDSSPEDKMASGSVSALKTGKKRIATNTSTNAAHVKKDAGSAEPVQRAEAKVDHDGVKGTPVRTKNVLNEEDCVQLEGVVMRILGREELGGREEIANALRAQFERIIEKVLTVSVVAE